MQSLAPLSEAQRPRTTRVLIVESNDVVAEGLQWALEAEGLEVAVAATASAVLPAVECFKPDVIVLELKLPDEDGRCVQARLAKRYDIPVIFSSGHAGAHEVEELLEAPHTAFLMKPYSVQDLLRVIERLSDESGAAGS